MNFTSFQNFFIPSEPYNSITYIGQKTKRPIVTIFYSVSIIICTTVTLISIFIFLRKLLLYENNPSNWLPEQIWTLCYLFSNLLFVNPIEVVILLETQQYTQATTFSNIAISYFGKYALMCIWLFYSAPLLCRQQSPWVFYTPRILYCLITCVLEIIISIYNFSKIIISQPSVTLYSVVDWPSMNPNTLYIITIICQCFKWFYFAIWIAQMAYTRYQLSKLSYMKNRYLHLSFRYFTLHGSLLILYLLLRFIFIDAHMFRNGLQSFEWAFELHSHGTIEMSLGFLFVTIYCIILAYIYLPINSSNRTNEIDLNILNAYVITEKEYTETVKLRKHLFQNLNQFQKLTEHQVYICCIDRAIELCKASYEVYFDQPGQPTTGGSGHDVDDLKDMDLESMGYTFIALYNDDTSDTFCCIGRHKITRKLLIMYRGTSSMKNWKTNSKYKQVAFLLHKESPHIEERTSFIKEFDSHVIYDSNPSRTGLDEDQTNLASNDTANETVDTADKINDKTNNETRRYESLKTIFWNYGSTILGFCYMVICQLKLFINTLIGKTCGFKILYKPFAHE